MAQLVYRAPGGQGANLIQSRSFVVLKGVAPEPLGLAVAAPSPLRRGQALYLRYAPGVPACARLYALDGGLVAMAEDSAGTGNLRFEGQDLATGVYLVDLRRVGQPVPTRPRLLKVAVLP